jgi:hypothetical protein
MSTLESVFVHRWNQDRTVDSICTVCYATVCCEPALSMLKEWEDAHECPGSALHPHHFSNFDS